MEHKLHVFGVGFYLLTIERNVTSLLIGGYNQLRAR